MSKSRIISLAVVIFWWTVFVSSVQEVIKTPKHGETYGWDMAFTAGLLIVSVFIAGYLWRANDD